MDVQQPTFEELVRRARQIQDAKDRGQDYSGLLAEFQSYVPCPDVGELFSGDYSAEYIAEYSRLWQREIPTLSRGELIRLVRKIINAEGSEAEITIMINQFDANCIHPAKNSLIYYPQEYFSENSDPTPEQIVEMALSSKYST